VSFFSIFLVLVCGLDGFAQSTGTIQGMVTDQSGAAIVGAKVKARNLATGVERVAESDSAGSYQN
jgi:hypothetical protein